MIIALEFKYNYCRLGYGVITLSLFTPVLYTARKNLTGYFR